MGHIHTSLWPRNSTSIEVHFLFPFHNKVTRQKEAPEETPGMSFAGVTKER